MTNQNIPEGFTKWDGGENPVPGQRVDVIYRDGLVGTIPAASNNDPFDWLHEPDTAEMDIIAYKVVEE